MPAMMAFHKMQKTSLKKVLATIRMGCNTVFRFDDDDNNNTSQKIKVESAMTANGPRPQKQKAIWKQSQLFGHYGQNSGGRSCAGLLRIVNSEACGSK